MNVVITGAGKGIGFDLTQRFAQDPVHRVWACSRNVSAFPDSAPSRLLVEAMDIAAVPETEIHQRVAAHFEQVDILIHNAGILINKPFVELTLSEWREQFEVNVFSAVKITRALLPLLRKSGTAHVVHIGSMGGVQGASKFPGLSAYSASKAALANLTECLAEELKPDGIHVNCLALGAVNTEMLRQAFPGYIADMDSGQMADFIHDFSLNMRPFFNGKILPVTASTP